MARSPFLSERRLSPSADKARRERDEYVRQLRPLQRVVLALELGKRDRELQKRLGSTKTSGL